VVFKVPTGDGVLICAKRSHPAEAAMQDGLKESRSVSGSIQSLVYGAVKTGLKQFGREGGRGVRPGQDPWMGQVGRQVKRRQRGKNP